MFFKKRKLMRKIEQLQEQNSRLRLLCEELEREKLITNLWQHISNESVEKHEVYAGRRVKRGLFRTSDGRKINADVNGSGNIHRKAIPNAFDKIESNEIQDVVVHPRRITLKSGAPKKTNKALSLAAMANPSLVSARLGRVFYK